jgi:Protein of unknown function (DUF3054)
MVDRRLAEEAAGPGPRRESRVAGWAELGADLAGVLVFAAVGRRSHAEGLTPAGVLATAAPFVAGLVVGWVVARGWRAPSRVWPTGVTIWLLTVAGGMLGRGLVGAGTAPSFVVVASIFLGLALLGRRGLSRIRRPTS